MITYTGTFKVIRQIVDWINAFSPEDTYFEEIDDYVNINGDTVTVLCQKEE